MARLLLVRDLITKVFFTSRASMLLLGAPGIGKSSIVRQAAEIIARVLGRELVEYDDDVAKRVLENPQRYMVFIDIRLTEVEPSDLMGVPRSDTDYVMYKPLMWTRVANRVPTIIFLDEINHEEDPMKLGAAYKIVLDKRAGYIRFHPMTMVIAAGNPPEHSSIAHELPAPFVNRTIVVPVEAESHVTWLEYMLQKASNALSMDEAVERISKVRSVVEEWMKKPSPGRLFDTIAAFIGYNPDALLKIPQATEMKNFPTPRTWEILYWTLTERYREIYSFEEAQVICEGLLGETGSIFAAWLWKSPPSIDEILAKPEIVKSLDEETVLILAAMLGRWISSNIDQITANKGLAKALDKVISEVEKRAGHESITVMIYAMGSKRTEMVVKAVKLKAVSPTFSTLVDRIAEVIKSVREEV